MAFDHSQTYRSRRLKDIVHRMRIANIMRVVHQIRPQSGSAYADIGCSNGYITDLIAREFELTPAIGYDHDTEHFSIGSAAGRDVKFEFVDLNYRGAIKDKYKFVTCFETLEHTGDLASATDNFLRAIDHGGVGLISVPIEIGTKGILKFLIKLIFYKYSLDELPKIAGGRWEYFKALLHGERMSRFRDLRAGWGTHFGFNYRDLDDLLEQYPVKVQAFNRGFSRFYIVRPRVNS